jgi:hypothetical protein
MILAEVIETAKLSYNQDIKDEDGKIVPLGTIKVRVLNRHSDANLDYHYARPFTLNLGMIPMNGEHVILFEGPAIDSKKNQHITPRYYYLPFPVNSTDDVVINQAPDYGYTTTKKNGTKTPKRPLKLGETFPLPARPISPLQPYEGDFLIQNRAGSSLRLGTGTKNSGQYAKKPDFHKDMNNGDPFFAMTLERPGSPKPRPVAENAKPPSGENKHGSDKKKSQTYRTETLSGNKTGIFGGITLQFKNIELARSRYSETKDIPRFKQPQILLDTDRIILNAKKDRLFLLGKKRVIIEGRKIQLTTDEHNVDWDDLVNRVQDLARELHRLTSAQAFYSTVFGPTGPATNLAEVLRIHLLCQRWHLVPPSLFVRLPSFNIPRYDFGINSVVPNIIRKYLRLASLGSANESIQRSDAIALANAEQNSDINQNFNAANFSGGVGSSNNGTNAGGAGSSQVGGSSNTGGDGLPKCGGTGGLCGPDGLPIEQSGSGIVQTTGSIEPILPAYFYPNPEILGEVQEDQINTDKSKDCVGVVYEFEGEIFDGLTGVSKPTNKNIVLLFGIDQDCSGWFDIEVTETEEDVNYFISDDSSITNDILADAECIGRELSKKVCSNDNFIINPKLRKTDKTVKIIKQ